MLIGHSGLMYGLKVSRIAKIDGRLGGGKTSLAFRLGYECLKLGISEILTANVSNVWNVFPDEWILDDKKKLNAFIVLDEAGKFIRTRAEASSYLDALRKINCILIAPSHESAPPNFGEITIEFESQLDVIGVPIWTYKWYRKGDEKHAQKFRWINPAEIFGIYSTGEYVITDNGIGQSLHNIIQEIQVENVRIYKPKKEENIQEKNQTRTRGTRALLPDKKTRDFQHNTEIEIQELVERIERIEGLQEKEDRKQKVLSIHKRRLR